MQVADLIQAGGKFERKKIAIEGVFVMIRGVGYFVQDATDRDNRGKAILVVSPGLENALLSSVPAYGGGPISYRDNAEISGVIIPSPSNEFALAITEIEDFAIYKYNERMRVNI